MLYLFLLSSFKLKLETTECQSLTPIKELSVGLSLDQSQEILRLETSIYRMLQSRWGNSEKMPKFVKGGRNEYGKWKVGKPMMVLNSRNPKFRKE